MKPMVHDLSLYVHFPWCLKKCPYCDFSSFRTSREEIPHQEYAEAVLSEIQTHVRRMPQGRRTRLTSIFFGGGTPSLWNPTSVAHVLQGARRIFSDDPERFEIPADLEVTAECNPSSLDGETIDGLLGAGINRMSIGVQSLDDKQLGFLGRLHSASDAVRVVRSALERTNRVSADLIFGLPGQPPAEAAAHVDDLLGLGLLHLSAYALTIEQGTQFGVLHRKGRLPMAQEDDVAEAFLAIEDVCARRGLQHYEVSNYGQEGHRSLHNQHYWRGGDYLGVGSGAVGCYTGAVNGNGADSMAVRYLNEKNPEAYIQSTMGGKYTAETEPLDGPTRAREALMLGLRTFEGVDVAHVGRLWGQGLMEVRGEALQRRVAAGDLLLEGNSLRVPRDRWLKLDGIVLDLF